MNMKPIHLVLHIPFEKLASGSSRFWGNPDLPQGTEYPMYNDSDDEEYPYIFICQINLKALHDFAPENPLPAKGLLSFFAKIDHYLGYMGDSELGGFISDPAEVKVVYFPDTGNLREVVLVDDDDKQMAPEEMEIKFAWKSEQLSDENELFAEPSHRQWETWDHPYEDWIILLQIDSFEGKDFILNFMDFGVLDFLISPKALEKADFSNVRGIVLST